MKATTYEPAHLKLWTLPRCYIGEVWPGYYSFLGRSRDSDALERANFDAGLRVIGGESETVRIVRETHWAVGWVEWIAIHQDDAGALARADAIKGSLEDYPVVCETLWSAYEQEDADQMWRNCYSVAERVEYIRRNRSQFEFRGLDDAKGCIRGDYFAGYASELIN